MTALTQDLLEPLGFVQLVTTITRAFYNQRDTILDHIWTNCSDKVVSKINDLRTLSDHNVIGAVMSLSDLKMGGQTLVRRKWKSFNEARCLRKFKNIDWTELYQERNPDLANSILEDRVVEVLESEAPMGVTQERNKYSCWLDTTTKAKMLERDLAREVARTSGKNPRLDTVQTA